MTNKYHIRFINLDSRPDRLQHMTRELQRVGIHAERFRAIPWREYQGGRRNIEGMMNRRTPGAIGCHYSQVAVMEEALKTGRHAWVMEDDLSFCDDFYDRFTLIEDWSTNNDWDVFWLGSTFHVNPPYWHGHKHSCQLPQCRCTLGRDAETTPDPRIIRTYGAFSTYAYLVNNRSIDKILKLFEQHVHESMGIDWLFIRFQPQLLCYSFVPGSVIQIDNQSDIGLGITRFSGFLQLNGTRENSAYVFQKKMTDFDPQKFQWHEAKTTSTLSA